MVEEKTILKKKKYNKPKYNMWQNSAFMIKLAWQAKEKKVLFFCLITALLSVTNNIINLYITPTILSAIERRVAETELIFTILAFVVGMMFVSAAFAYVTENSFFGRITVRAELIALLNKKAATTSYPNIDDEKFVKLSNKSSESVSSNSEATEAIWMTLTLLIENVLGFLIYSILLVSVKPLLLIVILATTLIGYFVNNYLSGYGYRHREEEAEHIKRVSYINNRSRDFSAAKDIRIFGLRPWLEEIGEKAMSAYVAFHKKAEGVYIWSRLLELVFAFLRNGIAYAYLIYLVLDNKLGVAEFLLFFTAVQGFTTWVNGVLENLNTLHKQSLDLSTVRECLEYPEPFKFEDGADLISDAEKKYEIRLENVSFRYPGTDKYTLSNINLTLHPGEKLAVVGLNGAGKTTLIKLICGFLDPTEGRVLLNNNDIREYNRQDYYKMFSAVFQSFSLLAATVAANVAQTEVNIDIKRVKECIDEASLTEKIISLPKQFDTFLNREVYEDAAMLSGGETQRLMLARALYKDAPFIILDEPTAALDPIAESDMYQKYNEMTKNKSSIYISHRLASTRFCDRIILIDNAEISEEGTHDSLMKLDGKYAKLYTVQSKYYQKGGEYIEE